MRNFQLLRSGRCRSRGPAANPGGDDAREIELTETHAIEDRKRFCLRAVRGDVHGPVGKHSIDVHREQTDIRPAASMNCGFQTTASGWVGAVARHESNAFPLCNWKSAIRNSAD